MGLIHFFATLKQAEIEPPAVDSDDGLWHDDAYFDSDDGLWHDDAYFDEDDGLWHDSIYF